MELGMEFDPQDVKAFLSERPLARDDAFGKTFLGHIPSNNSYGLGEMNVAIRVSRPRKEDLEETLHMQFKNELKLCSLQHRNIIGLIGFSKTNENFYLVYELFQAKPLSELIDGATTVKADIFAFGLLALQLITKDGRTAYAVEESRDISLHHILDLYVPMFREKGNLVHPSYGQQKDSRKLTEMIFNCLKKDPQLDLKSFRRDLVLLSLAKQC
ncbi:Cysteine-rich receptor-like protein kinase 21 [Bienertia sinuspersici]